MAITLPGEEARLVSFPPQFSQRSPSASLILSFLMHCLCFLFVFFLQSYSFLNLLQFLSDALALYLLALQLLSFSNPPVCSFSNSVFQSCASFVTPRILSFCFFRHLLCSILIILLYKSYSFQPLYGWNKWNDILLYFLKLCLTGHWNKVYIWKICSYSFVLLLLFYMQSKFMPC